MLLPEFCEELFYVKEINLFGFPFKIYLQKVYNYSFLETQKWLKGLNRNYSVETLKNYQFFTLRSVQLTKIPVLSLNLPNLKFLSLQDNKLTELPTLNLPNLQILSLSDNQLTELPMLNLPSLRELFLSYNKLTELRPLSLNFPNLQKLFLTHNPLTEKSKEYVKSLKIKNTYLKIEMKI